MADMLAMSVNDFLTATAAKQPTPGGGSVAALTGALAASLAAMAMEYTVGKKAYAAHDAAVRGALQQFHQASKLFRELLAEDVAAYAALSALLKLSPEERARNADYLPTVIAAIRVPQSVGALAMNVLDLCASLRDKTNKYILSDLAIAAVLAHATVHGSEFNVCINLPLLGDVEEAAVIRKSTGELTARADAAYSALRGGILSQG